MSDIGEDLKSSPSDVSDGLNVGQIPNRASPWLPITIACLLLAVGHAINAHYVDLVTLGLLIVAIVPWLRTYIAGIKVGNVELDLREIQKQVTKTKVEVAKNTQLLEKQRDLIDQVVKSSLSEFLFFHLRELYRRQICGDPSHFDFKSNNNDPMKRDFKMLMDLNYLKYFDLDSLHHGQDISRIIQLTENGRIYVELREPSLIDCKPGG